MPGVAASTSDTWVLGSAPNAVGAPENNLALEITWAWTSSPSTISQSPVLPLSNDMMRGYLGLHLGGVHSARNRCTTAAELSDASCMKVRISLVPSPPPARSESERKAMNGSA